MAVDINSLIRKIGGQEKVIDKDKAIIDLANEVANGGGGQTKRIVACWKVVGENEFEKIEKEVGEEKFIIGSTPDESEYIFTTDENEPNGNFEREAMFIAIHTGSSGIDIGTNNIITDMAIASEKDESNNLIAPNAIIRIFESYGQDPYLIIGINNDAE